jgi:transposase
MTTATILSGPERRRRWSSAEKLRIVEESLAPEARVTEVARRHDVHPNLLHLWRRQARAGTLVARPDPGIVPDGCGFVPIAVASGGGPIATRRAASAGPTVIEVVLRNGRVLRVPDGVAPARAVGLADALEGLDR